MLGTVEVLSVPAELTFPLRQQVLRPHQSLAEMAKLGQGSEDGLVLAARLAPSGDIVATGAVVAEAPPAELVEEIGHRGPAWRVRGMATRTDARGAGIGASVLEVLVEHVAGRGGGLLWCNARTGATTLYERAGFRSFGDEFEAPLIGPHIVMWRLVP